MNINDATEHTTKLATMNQIWKKVYWETKNTTYDQIYEAPHTNLITFLVATRIAIMEATYDEMTEILF